MCLFIFYYEYYCCPIMKMISKQAEPYIRWILTKDGCNIVI